MQSLYALVMMAVTMAPSGKFGPGDVMRADTTGVFPEKEACQKVGMAMSVRFDNAFGESAGLIFYCYEVTVEQGNAIIAHKGFD